MKKRVVSLMLIAVMLGSSVVSASAADFNVSDEIGLLEQYTGESSTDWSYEEGTSSDTVDSVDEGSFDETPTETEEPTENVDNGEESKYTLTVNPNKSWVFFKNDLENLKISANEEDFSEDNVLDDGNSETTEEPEDITKKAERYNLDTTSLEVIKNDLPDDYSDYLNLENVIELLDKSEITYTSGELVGAYIVPYDSFDVESVTLDNNVLTPYEGSVYYEATMGNANSTLTVNTVEKVEEPEVSPEPEVDVVEDESTDEVEEVVSDVEEQELSDGDEKVAICECGATEEDPYQHAWDCEVFLKQFLADCDCVAYGSPDSEFGTCTDTPENFFYHDFKCKAVQKAFEAVCTCDSKGIEAVHDDCEVIKRLHKMMCDCGEDYESVDDVLNTHTDEESMIVKYINTWANYYNKPEELWSHSSYNEVAVSNPDSSYLKPQCVTRNTAADKAYSFVLKWDSANGFDYSTNKNVYSTKTTNRVEYKASKVTMSTDTSVNPWIRYKNVGTYNGTKIDLLIVATQCYGLDEGNASDPPIVNFWTNRIGFTNYKVYRTRFHMYFLKNGTSGFNNKVNVKGHFTIKDIDGENNYIGNGLRVYTDSNIKSAQYLQEYWNSSNDSISTSKSWLQVKYYKRETKNATYKFTEITGPKVGTAKSNLPSGNKYKCGWITFNFEGNCISIQNLLSPSWDQSGGNHTNGVWLDSQIANIYNPPQNLDKRVGKTTDTWTSMSAHNTASGGYSTSLGSSVRYILHTSTLPSTYSQYRIVDMVDPCLQITANSIKVYKNEALTSECTSMFNTSLSEDKRTVAYAVKSNYMNDYAFTDNNDFYFVFNATVTSSVNNLFARKHHTSNDGDADTAPHIGASGNAVIKNNAKSYVTSNDTSMTVVSNDSYIKLTVPKSITITKVDKDDTTKKLKGAIFKLYSWDGSKYVYTKDLTDNNDGTYSTGTFNVNSTNDGKFQIKEDTPPKNYTGNWSLNINYRNGTNTGSTFTVENEPTKYRFGTISITKVDKTTGKVITTATDGEFTIYEWNKDKSTYEDTCEATAKTFKSSESGNNKVSYNKYEKKYKSGNLYITDKNAGRFKVVETKNPTGYEGTWEQEFTLDIVKAEDGEPDSKSFTVENPSTIPPMGKIIVNKTIKKSDVHWAFGNPTFRFTVSGTDSQWNEKHTWQGYVEFKENMQADASGNLTLSYVIENVPIGTYEITEADTLSYKFESCKKVTSNVSEKGNYLVATLAYDKDSDTVPTAEGTFSNSHLGYDQYRHTDVVENLVSTEWK